VVEGQDVVDAIAQGDLLESVEIVRVGEEAENGMLSKHLLLLRERNKRDIALKADAEAVKLPGLKKTAVCYQFIQRGKENKL
jgi:peptidyl-prolyl cis-trans isomerase A (cyclophilin A)